MCPTGGCLSASLATDTGPSMLGAWSTAAVQTAHAGEVVGCSVLLRDALKGQTIHAGDHADYIVVTAGGTRIEADVRLDGRFEFDWQIDPDLPDGHVIDLKVQVCELLDLRDQMYISGRWMHSSSPTNRLDAVVATCHVRLQVYRSIIEYRPDSVADLQWHTARAVLTRADGKLNTIYVKRPGRPGLDILQADASGRGGIRYAPRADQINKRGQTSVALHVLDRGGREHVFRFEVETP